MVRPQVVAHLLDAAVEVLHSDQIADEVVGEASTFVLRVFYGAEAAFDIPTEAVGTPQGIGLLDAIPVGRVLSAPLAAARVE